MIYVQFTFSHFPLRFTSGQHVGFSHSGRYVKTLFLLCLINIHAVWLVKHYTISSLYDSQIVCLHGHTRIVQDNQKHIIYVINILEIL